MSISARLQQVLVRSRVEYDLIQHREAFTAGRVAQESHIRGRNLAKVVVVRTPEPGYLMTVLPASCHIDLARLERMTGRPGLELASERELQRLFPDCEAGAMPPFGHLYGLPIFLDACFRDHEDIWFQAGNHHEVVRLSMPEYERLAGPFARVECLHEDVRVVA
jgi:Ala-tRNA(Pro) deacylase